MQFWDFPFLIFICRRSKNKLLPGSPTVPACSQTCVYLRRTRLLLSCHPPPLWTHTSSQCAEKFHEKNVHVHWRMSSSWENNIHLNSELWKPTFPSNAVYIKVCALCLCPSRGDDVLLLKIKIIIVRRNFLGNIFCPLTIFSPVHKIQCQIPQNPVFHLLCYPSRRSLRESEPLIVFFPPCGNAPAMPSAYSLSSNYLRSSSSARQFAS